MGLFDWFTGTKRPEQGVKPRSSQEVYQALMSVNRPDASYEVRDGRPEGVDLVCEWRVMNPYWYEYFRIFSEREFYSILLRFDPDQREIRSTDHKWTIDWVRGVPQVVHGAEFERGQAKSVKAVWALRKGEDGKRRWERQATFSTSEMKNPLRKAVTDCGWTWRGVSFAKL
ncbi:hypothetical protein J2S53_002393 [Actinopolyspora lacussalsi]|nr:hypothetical protein [Actinopolyspora lacussalsi]